MTLAITSSESKISYFPTIKTVQRGLLGTTVACAALSLIPPFRFIGSLSLRSVATLSSITNLKSRWSKDDYLDRALKCGHIALVTLGIVTIVTSQPMLLIAALSADIALIVLEQIKDVYSCRDRSESLIARCTQILVDVLTLTAIALASWKVLVAAALVNTVSLLILGVFFENFNMFDDSPFEMFCCLALAAINVVGAFSIAQYTKTVGTSYFSIKNQYDENMVIKDWYGKTVGSVKPGETIKLALPTKNLTPAGYYTQKNGENTFNQVGYSINGYREISPLQTNFSTFLAENTDYATFITKNPIAVKDLPTFPVSGISIVTKAPNWHYDEDQLSV